MAEGIADLLGRKDAIRDDEFVGERFQVSPVSPYRIKLTEPREPSSWASMRTRRSLMRSPLPSRFST